MSYAIEIIGLLLEFLILIAIVDPRLGKSYLKLIAKRKGKRKSKKQFVNQLENLFQS